MLGSIWNKTVEFQTWLRDQARIRKLKSHPKLNIKRNFEEKSSDLPSSLEETFLGFDTVRQIFGSEELRSNERSKRLVYVHILCL